MARSSVLPSRNLLILDTRDAILGVAPMLQSLAQRCGQPGAMHWLEYFLHPTMLGHRAPRLVLLLGSEQAAGEPLTADDLQAAAMFFEYEVAGFCTGVVATGDAVGFNTVIAPPGNHAQVTALASRALVERGAFTVLATFEGSTNQDFSRWISSTYPMATAVRVREVPRMLPLRASLDATLARMGKTTRFNLRYYRRRLEKERKCTFVAEAAPLLSGADLQQLNAGSLNPVPEEQFRLRVASSSKLPGSFLCGLRDEDGCWISLVGGWRQGGTTVLYWQMNRAGMEKHSIGTVMRSYFLEHEIAQGAQSLLIYGGTPHSMRHAFSRDQVSDFVVKRVGLRSSALQLAFRLLTAARRKSADHFVLGTICDTGMQWQSQPAVSAAGRAVGLEATPARRVA